MVHPIFTAVDCHAHVIAKDRPITTHRHQPPERDYTAAELLANFDSVGVSHGVLTAPSYYLNDNSLLLEALAASSRLRGTVNLAPETSVEEMVALREKGVCGVRLNWYRKPALPDIREQRDLMARIRDAGLHLEMFIEGQHLPAVLPAIEQSGVKLVLDHFGCPDPDGGVRSAGFVKMLDLMNRGRAWVKLSAPYRLQEKDFETHARTYVRAMLSGAGPQQLVWASDWPWGAHEEGMTYSRCIDWLTDWVPDAAARQHILSVTPVSLFGFDT